MLNRPLPAPVRDIAVLIGRVILGVVLFAHGWQKLMINGIAGTYAQFDQLGIPLAIVSASFASFVEFVGGVLIIVGGLTTTVVALDLVVMVGAAGFVHFTHGIFAQNGGWELVGVIVAAELALAAFGPGRFSVDHLIAGRHDRERDEFRRRMRKPVRRAPAVSETFRPAVEAAAARSYPSGAFATPDPLAGPQGTGAFAQVPAAQVLTAQVPAVQVPTRQVPAVQVPTVQVPTGQLPTGQIPTAEFAAGGGFGDGAHAETATGQAAHAAPAASAEVDSATAAFRVDAPACAGSAATGADGGATGAFRVEAPAGVGPAGAGLVEVSSATAAFTAEALGRAGSAAAGNGGATGAFRVGARGSAHAATAAVPFGAEESTGPLPVRTAAAHRPVVSAGAVAPGADASFPRMASAGVHRAIAERSGRPADEAPAPFGVTVQSPLDFTPTTAMPVVPSTPITTEMVVITSTGPELPRRVRPYA